MGRIALVTGANQGLGLALVKGLSEELGRDDIVYLTARNAEKGQAALHGLESTASNIRFERLDVTDDENVVSLAQTLRDRHGTLDIVISNAAARIAMDVPFEQQVRTFIDTNNHGTCRMLRHFLPMLRDNGRFVVVASSFGTLRNLPPPLHRYFDVDAAILEDIEVTMDHYVAAVESNTAGSEGWPEWINIPSKIGQVASAKVAARMLGTNRPASGVLINATCPGLVDTAASRPWFDDMSGAQSPDTAAVDIVWLACLPGTMRKPQGELVQFRKILPWR